MKDLVGAVSEASEARLPELAREALAAIVQQLEALQMTRGGLYRGTRITAAAAA